MAAPESTDSPAVERYAATLEDLSPAERSQRLDVIEAFAAYVERSPDEMIDEIFDEQTRKYRKRGFYTDHARDFAASYGDSPNAQLQRANVVRAFFIANGRRLLPDQPAWMRD